MAVLRGTLSLLTENVLKRQSLEEVVGVESNDFEQRNLSPFLDIFSSDTLIQFSVIFPLNV